MNQSRRPTGTEALLEALGLRPGPDLIEQLPPAFRKAARGLEADVLADVAVYLYEKALIGDAAAPAEAHRVRPGAHSCLFYADESELVEHALPYFDHGVEQDQACVWILPPALRASGARALAGRPVELLTIDEAAGELSGRVERLERFWMERCEAAVRAGKSGLRGFGVVDWPGSRFDCDRLLGFEERVHQAFPSLPLVGLCAYPLRGPYASEIAPRVLACHAAAHFKTEAAWRRLPATPALAAMITRGAP